MNSHNWLLAVLPIETWRVKKSINKSLDEFNEKGTLNSSIAFTSSMHVGFDETDSLIESAINKLSQKRIKAKEWNVTKEFLLEYIDVQYESILKHVEQGSGYTIKKFGAEEMDKIVGPRKSESKAMLDLCIDKHIDSIKNKRWILVWDIVKILASAFIGALIALLIQ